MKKRDIAIGGVYLAKVSDRIVRVRVYQESPFGGWDCVNLKTGRKIHVRSPQRFRGVAESRKEPLGSGPVQGAGMASGITGHPAALVQVGKEPLEIATPE